jgi:hypothetical protein
MSIKSTVNLTGLVPQMVLAYVIAREVFRGFGALCVITSANDSVHGPNSLHSRDGICRAIDLRTKYPALDGRELELRNAVREALGPQFDVVIEAIGTENEHMHVEYDPKEIT